MENPNHASDSVDGWNRIRKIDSRAFAGGVALVLFDCDAAVHRLLESDPEIAAFIRSSFGDQALDARGQVDRQFLRTMVFANESSRLHLESVLHPKVREECLDSLARAANQGAETFVADVPLLFETGFDFGQTQIIVVASSPSTQIQRLKSRSGLDSALIDSILAAQLPVHEQPPFPRPPV
jgi:dephospho-CoA kinase